MFLSGISPSWNSGTHHESTPPSAPSFRACTFLRLQVAEIPILGELMTITWPSQNWSTTSTSGGWSKLGTPQEFSKSRVKTVKTKDGVAQGLPWHVKWHHFWADDTRRTSISLSLQGTDCSIRTSFTSNLRTTEDLLLTWPGERPWRPTLETFKKLEN